MPQPELDTAHILTGSDASAIWRCAVPNGHYAVVVVAGDPESPAHTNDLVLNGQALADPDPYDPAAAPGYAHGDYDGWAVDVEVTDGYLTLAAGANALDPELCLVEVGPRGSAVDDGLRQKLAGIITRATNRTAGEWFNHPPTPRTYAYGGDYIDAPLAMRAGSGADAHVYFIHANALYSPQALTNEAGQVVERYSYTAYGERAVLGGCSRATSRIGFGHGFTGLRDECGLLFARNRYFSTELGNWVSRDPIGYADGYSLYGGYFVPNAMDPEGKFFFLAGFMIPLIYAALPEPVQVRVNAVIRIGGAILSAWAASASVVFGPAVAAWAGDQIGTGLKEFVTGAYQDSVGAQIVKLAAGSGTAGKVLSFIYDLGPTGVTIVRSTVRAVANNPLIKLRPRTIRCPVTGDPVVNSGPIPLEDYQRKVLEAMTKDEAAKTIALTPNINVLRANKASPVLSGVINKKTGRIYFAQNSLTGSRPLKLNPILEERINLVDVKENNPHFSNPGSHAEVYAVNDALNQGAQLTDLVGFNVWVKTIEGTQMTQLETALRCGNCKEILYDIEFLYDLIKEVP